MALMNISLLPVAHTTSEGLCLAEAICAQQVMTCGTLMHSFYFGYFHIPEYLAGLFFYDYSTFA
jgi:uncharacterized membrane protein